MWFEGRGGSGAHPRPRPATPLGQLGVLRWGAPLFSFKLPLGGGMGTEGIAPYRVHLCLPQHLQREQVRGGGGGGDSHCLWSE